MFPPGGQIRISGITRRLWAELVAPGGTYSRVSQWDLCQGVTVCELPLKRAITIFVRSAVCLHLWAAVVKIWLHEMLQHRTMPGGFVGIKHILLGIDGLHVGLWQWVNDAGAGGDYEKTFVQTTTFVSNLSIWIISKIFQLHEGSLLLILRVDLYIVPQWVCELLVCVVMGVFLPVTPGSAGRGSTTPGSWKLTLRLTCSMDRCPPVLMMRH